MSRPLCLWILIVFTAKIKAVPTNKTESWDGKWFPLNPLKPQSKHNDLNELFDEKVKETNNKPNDTWDGKWFPHVPSGETTTSSRPHMHSECDDGKNNIDIDFDPANKTHSYNYLCLDHKDKYEPSFATFPLERVHTIPPAYKAPSYCLNQTIEYQDLLPTYGAHRHLYPKYGEYKFLPIQRWMHNLEYGTIVMLYHPCAYQMQIETLRSTLKSCLYRHIITPSTLLRPKRPLALIAWGKSLEMSVVDVPTIVSFIKENAKRGPQTTQQPIQGYDAGLLVEAKLTTDESDSEICANVNL